MFVRPQGGEGSSSVRMVDATSMPSIPSLNGPWSNAQIWRYILWPSSRGCPSREIESSGLPLEFWTISSIAPRVWYRLHG
ncbi:hypothetical protein BO83DRAFT_402422 [Aspergillus eucalypticola CBS 122712]|uniref:Uncharacterized protein n=1 Tax=Aspergillus eucalypticola (strain CBS 122712 / IBT 29274) TaxID=1448314 RepID=A0A317UW40_ASPEC|nr:uncharacterized protein BO83DRAFT_402422 [Aspergillus eucalypticola CBS 122712]PWY64692.1 hypothetical protein BO83DRAFT_402422 [Aspergillus eucalypticola CBS 122712]